MRFADQVPDLRHSVTFFHVGADSLHRTEARPRQETVEAFARRSHEPRTGRGEPQGIGLRLQNEFHPVVIDEHGSFTIGISQKRFCRRSDPHARLEVIAHHDFFEGESVRPATIRVQFADGGSDIIRQRRRFCVIQMRAMFLLFHVFVFLVSVVVQIFSFQCSMIDISMFVYATLHKTKHLSCGKVFWIM